MTGTTRMTMAERRGVPGPPRTSISAQAEAAAAGVVLRLQREAGNEAVAQLLLTGHGPGPAPFLVARDPTDGGHQLGPPTPAGAPGADTTKPYQDLLQPSLDEAQQQTLHQAAGGAGLVDLIGQRDQLRTLLIRASYDAPSGGVPEPSFGTVDGGTGAGSRATENPEQAAADRAEEERLTAQINAKLAELGVADEADLIDLVNNRFPTMFLGEAKTVALGMLDDNQQKVQGELDRYSQEVCSPDIEGLLAANAELGQLDPHELEISISAAEHALAVYQPSAGVLTPDQLAERIPENERSVMVDIANGLVL